MAFENIASRAFNTPLIIEPRKAVAFAAGLGVRLTGGAALDLSGVADLAANAPAPSNQPFASILDDSVKHSVERGSERRYAIKDGVAIIPITGVLIHRGSWVGKSSGQTSYEGISAQIEMAQSDPDVRAVALEFDSFGGEVAGCFDLADQIRALRDVKPVAAFVAEHSYSAGYALASQASKIILPRTGGVGSIGVVIMHVEYEQAVADAGMRVTLIHAGERKVDGNPYAELPEDVRDEWQAEVENTRQLFAETVAKGRGGSLSVEDALATQARCLTGQEAVDAGLADAVATPREAFREFVSEVNGRSHGFAALSSPTAKTPQTGEHDMSTAAPKPTGTKAGKGRKPASADVENQDDNTDENTGENTGETSGDLTQTGQTDAGQTGEATTTAGKQQGAQAPVDQKARIQGIQGHAEAKGREELANHLAFDTEMTVEAAAGILKASPKAETRGPLGSAMLGDDSALDTSGGDEGQSEGSMVSAMAAKFK